MPAKVPRLAAAQQSAAAKTLIPHVHGDKWGGAERVSGRDTAEGTAQGTVKSAAAEGVSSKGIHDASGTHGNSGRDSGSEAIASGSLKEGGHKRHAFPAEYYVATAAEREAHGFPMLETEGGLESSPQPGFVATQHGGAHITLESYLGIYICVHIRPPHLHFSFFLVGIQIQNSGILVSN